MASTFYDHILQKNGGAPLGDAGLSSPYALKLPVRMAPLCDVQEWQTGNVEKTRSHGCHISFVTRSDLGVAVATLANHDLLG